MPRESHGDSNTRLYGVWLAMRRRCYLESCKDYKNYGARGISVCKEWKDSYLSFKSWATSNKYEEGLELDRINTNGDYEPSNCRWITRVENARNKRSTVFLELNGERKTLQEWALEYNLPPKTVRDRYRKGVRGKDLLAPLTIHKPPKSEPSIFIEIDGELKSLNEWADHLGMSRKTISWRYHSKGLRGRELIAPIGSKQNSLTIGNITKPIAEWAREYELSYQLLSRRIKNGTPKEKLLEKPKRHKKGE